MTIFRKKSLLILTPLLAILSWVILASPFLRETEKEVLSNRREAAEVVFPIEVSVASKGDLIKRIITNGVIRPNREAEIIARVAGEIVALHAANGDYVARNATLLRIDDREYRLAYERSQAALLQAQIDYKTMSSYGEFGGIDSLNVRENSRIALGKFQQAEQLFKQGSMSAEDFYRARRDYETDSAFYGAHREDVMSNRSGLAAARESFGRAKLNLESTEMKAPFGGYVADCNVAVGQQVNANQSAIKIVDVSRLLVDVDVLENEIGRVSVGAVAEVSVNAFPDKKFFGHVKTINPIVDSQSKAVRVTIELKNGTFGTGQKDLRLRPGMFATVAVQTEIFKDRLLAPKAALLIRDQRPLVFVAEQGLAKWHYIEIGEENDEFIEIRSGVNVGDSVIVEGHYTLAHDAKIRVRGK